MLTRLPDPALNKFGKAWRLNMIRVGKDLPQRFGEHGITEEVAQMYLEELQDPARALTTDLYCVRARKGTVLLYERRWALNDSLSSFDEDDTNGEERAQVLSASIKASSSTPVCPTSVLLYGTVVRGVAQAEQRRDLDKVR